MSYKYTAKALSQVGAGQELATKQYMKEPPNSYRDPKAAAQFLLCHTSSSSAFFPLPSFSVPYPGAQN